MTVKYFKEVKLLNIAICDDEKFQRETIRKRLEDFFKEQNSNYTVEEFSSAEQVLDYCKDKNNSTIDLLLLDIEMPGMDGISLKDNLFYQSKIKYRFSFVYRRSPFPITHRYQLIIHLITNDI